MVDDMPRLIEHVQANFSRIYLGGIPSLLNDDGAFLSFICVLTGTEALGGFLGPDEGNGRRFKDFVERFFPNSLKAEASDLWKLRNAIVHGFSPQPYVLTHHNGHLHLARQQGTLTLNAEDFYAALVSASRRYFDELRRDRSLQEAFLKRAEDPETGVLVVGPVGGRT